MGLGIIGAFIVGLATACLLFFSGALQDVPVPDVGIDSSISSCLNEIKRKIEIMELKFPGNVKSNIYESNKFNNKQSTLDYLEEWGYLGPIKYISFPELYGMNQNKQYDDIIISLVEIEASYNGEYGGGLIPLICIDGSLTERSKQRLSILY